MVKGAEGAACVNDCMLRWGDRERHSAREGCGAKLKLLSSSSPALPWPAKNHRISDLQRAQDLHGDEWEAV